jgi:hypothetical protein
MPVSILKKLVIVAVTILFTHNVQASIISYNFNGEWNFPAGEFYYGYFSYDTSGDPFSQTGAFSIYADDSWYARSIDILDLSANLDVAGNDLVISGFAPSAPDSQLFEYNLTLSFVAPVLLTTELSLGDLISGVGSVDEDGEPCCSAGAITSIQRISAGAKRISEPNILAIFGFGLLSIIISMGCNRCNKKVTFPNKYNQVA